MSRHALIHDEDVRNRVLEFIGNGNYIKTACAAAGINERTLYNWTHIADEYARFVKDNGHDIESHIFGIDIGYKVKTKDAEIYYHFLQELKIARQANIAERVKRIQEAGRKPQHWTANAWLLERMEPADFGRRMEMEIGPSKVLIALQEQAGKWAQLPVVQTAKQLPEGQEQEGV